MTRESGYRLNVGLIVVNHKGKLLLCKRKDSENWQFPQGGIDLGEKPEQAALRELYEEVGIDRSDVQEIACSEDWYKYDLPEASLEALINYQTMICDLTGMEIANASLLDEPTAAAEAMMLAKRLSK